MKKIQAQLSNKRMQENRTDLRRSRSLNLPKIRKTEGNTLLTYKLISTQKTSMSAIPWRKLQISKRQRTDTADGMIGAKRADPQLPMSFTSWNMGITLWDRPKPPSSSWSLNQECIKKKPKQESVIRFLFTHKVRGSKLEVRSLTSFTPQSFCMAAQDEAHRLGVTAH